MADVFTFPTRILFGAGARKFLGRELAALKATRPLVVTDRGVVASGVLDQALSALRDPPSAIFDAVEANPTQHHVRAGAAAYAEHRCDSVVAVGGGSAMDAAKAIAIKATHAASLADLEKDWRKIHAPVPTLVAMPTTAGTGSEVGYAALITLEDPSRKATLFSPHLIPKLAVCDPELTLGLPRSLTAGTGMDALSHCVESYLSTHFQPLCDGVVLEGLRHVRDGLVRAFEDGADMEARTHMMLAALMGGVGMQKGLGAAHALAHAISSQIAVHHGTLMAVLLPHAIRLNAEAVGPRLCEMALALGCSASGNEPHTVADELARHVRHIANQVRLPGHLTDLGVPEHRLDGIVSLALADPSLRTNPRECSADDLHGLLTAAC